MKTGGDVVVVISWDVAPAHADARALPRLRFVISVAAPATLPASSALETQFELSSRLHHDARPAGAREELVQGDAYAVRHTAASHAPGSENFDGWAREGSLFQEPAISLRAGVSKVPQP